MNEVEKRLQRLRKWEGELICAPPKRAATLAARIVRLKATIFDKEDK